MSERKGYYSMGLAGYEVWPDPNNHERLMARFVGTEKEHQARSYKIRYVMTFVKGENSV